jgi:predicted SAM-dependent methyltransferase
MTKNSLKLNLGCSVDRLEGYTNIDNHTQADIKHDILQPLPFKDGEVGEILASHLLEHFSYEECDIVLKDWHSVLKEGGILHIRVPDMPRVCQDYINSDDERRKDWAIKEIFGGQWNCGEFHKNGFSESILIETVCKHGFEVAEILKPRTKVKTFPRFKGDNEIVELNIKFKKICQKE